MSDNFNNHNTNAFMGPYEDQFYLGYLDYECNRCNDDVANSSDPVLDFHATCFPPDTPLSGWPGSTGQSVLRNARPRDISEGSASALSAQSPSHVESVEPKHNDWICQVCNESFTDYIHLHDHARFREHATWVCYHSDCNNRYILRNHLWVHQETPHLPSHHEVWDDSALACAECSEPVHNATALQRHANARKHGSYACLCGVKFARRDVLIRHLKGFDKESATYPCTFCRSHRGKQAFRRRDHLVQHLRGYHKMEQEEINDIFPPKTRLQSRQILICPYKDCEAYRDDAFKALPYETQFKARPFQKQADYNKHMRDVHEDSPFSCSVANCDRVRAKGYMREKDLMKHMTDKHPEAPSYVPSEPSKYHCGRCGKIFDTNSALTGHQMGSLRCRSHRNETNFADHHN